MLGGPTGHAVDLAVQELVLRVADCRSYPHLHKKEMTTRMLTVLDNASLCPIVFGVLERLKAELRERGIDWRADPERAFRQP